MLAARHDNDNEIYIYIYIYIYNFSIDDDRNALGKHDLETRLSFNLE